VLSIQQLYRISTMYWDDKYGTHSVSSDVSCSKVGRMLCFCVVSWKWIKLVYFHSCYCCTLLWDIHTFFVLKL
jgi:hypothetical protein